MSNSIKQLVNLLVSYIDRTLLPLLDHKLPQTKKSIDLWHQLKNFLSQTDQFQIWKIQKFIVDMPLRPVNTHNTLGTLSTLNIQSRKITSQNNDKIPQNLNIRNNNQYLQPQQWKYRFNQNIPMFQPQRKQNYTLTTYTNNTNNNNNQLQKQKNQKQKEKQIEQDRLETKTNIQSFQDLLSSFRKLCTNFQNNHKKLVMDREGFMY